MDDKYSWTALFALYCTIASTIWAVIFIGTTWASLLIGSLPFASYLAILLLARE